MLMHLVGGARWGLLGLLCAGLMSACGEPDAMSTETSVTEQPTTEGTTDDTLDTTGETGQPTGESSDATSTTAGLPSCETPEGGVIAISGETPPQPLPVVLEPGAVCELELTLDTPRIVAVHAPFVANVLVADTSQSEPGWVRPTLLQPGSHELVLEHTGMTTVETTVALSDFGPPVEEVVRERSLVWTDPALTDGPDRCGLACVMAAIAEDGHGGRLLQHWFDRFATTAHSERLGPAQFLDAFAEELGPDPSLWDLDALPFVVTAVHNRIDLNNGEHCGEFRISMASTDPIYRPFHLIFLFIQPPQAEDLSPAGVAHCTQTALRWAELSALDQASFVAEAGAWMEELVAVEGFVAAESLEFMISPWEWRQWFFEDSPEPQPGLSQVLENRPLFQTLDIPRLNQPGDERDAFLQWVADNAAALNDRQLLLPESYRAPSARLNQGVPWVPLNLDGVEPGVLEQFPELRQNLEIIGCPACHATDAEFVQTLPDRTFSPFYDSELDAREVYLQDFAHGLAATPPHGPLQSGPVLPP